MPGFRCNCPIGFSASLCEIRERSACDSSPCQNGGSCTLKSLSDYVCSCAQGYTGNIIIDSNFGFERKFNEIYSFSPPHRSRQANIVKSKICARHRRATMAAPVHRCPVATSNAIARKVSRAGRAPTMWRSANWIHANTEALVATRSAPTSKSINNLIFRRKFNAAFRDRVPCRVSTWELFHFHWSLTDSAESLRALQRISSVKVFVVEHLSFIYVAMVPGLHYSIQPVHRTIPNGEKAKTRTLTHDGMEWKLTRILCSENQNRN